MANGRQAGVRKGAGESDQPDRTRWSPSEVSYGFAMALHPRDCVKKAATSICYSIKELFFVWQNRQRANGRETGW